MRQIHLRNMNAGTKNIIQDLMRRKSRSISPKFFEYTNVNYVHLRTVNIEISANQDRGNQIMFWTTLYKNILIDNSAFLASELMDLCGH